MSFAYSTIKLMISHVSLLVILSVHMGKLWLLLLLFLVVERVNMIIIAYHVLLLFRSVILEILSNSRTLGESWGFPGFHI